MFKYNGFLQNAQNSGLYGSIKVLIVDHNKDFLAYIGEVLHSCSFEVTCVDHSGTALRLLSSENKNKFDLLLIDRDMSDVDVLTFLRLTTNMDVLSVVISEQEDDAFLFEAFKNGAFHVLKKPISIDTLRIIRQVVMRERILKNNNNDKFNNNSNNKKSIHRRTPHYYPIHEPAGKKSGYDGGRKKRCHSSQDADNDVDCYEASSSMMKKKTCVQWTQELHAKFLKVVKDLGHGGCFPKDIQERMGVPGLTRMQVASHLQKCRKEDLRLNQKQAMATNNLFSQGVVERKFGCMPSVPIDQNEQEESSTLIGINLSINGWQKEMNNNLKNNNAKNYRSASMMNNMLNNERNIEKCTQYVSAPFASDLSSNNQDNGFGSKASLVTTTNYFQQELPGACDTGHAFDQHGFPSIRSPTSEEFPDFLRDAGGNGPNDI